MEINDHINKAWTILAKGKPRPSEIWHRLVNPVSYKDPNQVLSIINTLVPYEDNLFRSFQIDQLIKLVLQSEVRDRFLEFDDFNTYQQVNLLFPEAGEFTDATGVRFVFLTEEDAHENLGQGLVKFDCELDPSAKTLTTQFDTHTYTITNNLSSPIELAEGFVIRLQGAQPSVTQFFQIEYVAKLSVDWVSLLNTLENSNLNLKDDELRTIWNEDPSWINRISAVVQYAVENAFRG
jgi:hypothetical protein